MTPIEFRRALTAIGLSQAEMARCCGVTPRVVNMWASGDRKVPSLVQRVTRLMVVGKLPPALLLAAGTGPRR